MSDDDFNVFADVYAEQRHDRWESAVDDEPREVRGVDGVWVPVPTWREAEQDARPSRGVAY